MKERRKEREREVCWISSMGRLTIFFVIYQQREKTKVRTKPSKGGEFKNWQRRRRKRKRKREADMVQGLAVDTSRLHCRVVESL
jgi:hypothetical protein